jgi:dipeptidyl-peptidase-4
MPFRVLAFVSCVAFVSLFPSRWTQAQFKELPGYEKYREITSLRTELSGGGRVEQIRWAEDGGSVQYSIAGKRKSIDLKTLVVSEGGAPAKADETEGRRGQRRQGQTPVGRAQQRSSSTSPDGKWKAVYSNFNITLEPTSSESERIQVTQDGVDRLRFGTGCWVYGEELKQSDAMWWSPDSSKLAYYEIDEREMMDYHLTLDNTANYTTLQSVRYPKAGDPNPKVAIWIYDLKSKNAKKVAMDGDPSQYLYSIRFSPEGNELLVNRTNRRQDVLNVLAIDTVTLNVRTVLTERQSTWQENSPSIQFLEDKKRFVWETESNGWKHFQLRHLDGKFLNSLSPVGEYACNAINKIDEKAGYVYFTAFSDTIPYNAQLHRVRLDGSQPVRLTASPLHHTSFDISPDHRFVIATREQTEIPPSTVLYNDAGKEVAILAQGNRDAAENLKLPPAELFSFLSDDGKTTIYGTLHKPSNFDASRKYPLLVDVYGGPESIGVSSRYSAANPICELGYLVAKIGNRGTKDRGKAFESATYLKLGGPDMDDQATGVKFLRQRSYVDGGRVGIYGHSYGGYMSALALLRYPDVFQVAVAGAPVTDFRNYDTIYTERYMQTPAENAEGYDAGSCNKIANQLKGKLLLVHGLIDDNVHPANTWQLSKALNDADKRFQMMIYPEFQHGVGSTYSALRWEFFHEHLKP